MAEVTSEREFSVLFQLADGVIHLSSFYHFRVESFIKKCVSEIQHYKSKFASIDHVGPKWVADFLEKTDIDERAIMIRKAYENSSELLSTCSKSHLGTKASNEFMIGFQL